MHDNTLIAIAMCVSSTGIVGLLVALTFLTPEQYSFDETRSLPDSAPVRVNGTVLTVRTIGNMTIMTITQPSKLDVVLDGSIDIDVGDCVVVSGKKERYKENVQIVPNKVMRC